MKRTFSPTFRAEIIEYFAERFGVTPEYFDDLLIYEGSRERVYMISQDMESVAEEVVSGLNIARVSAVVKPTTDFLQLLGQRITRNKVELSREQTISHLSGDDLELEEDALLEMTAGYVAISYCGTVVACGFYKEGLLRNMIAKHRRRLINHL